jgi:uncharacterized membrane protein
VGGPGNSGGAGDHRGAPGAARAPGIAREIRRLHEQIDKLESLVSDETRGAAPSTGAEPPAARTGEHRLPVAGFVVVAIVLQVLLPERLALHPSWILPGLEAALVVGLTAANPRRIDRSSRALRSTSVLLIASISFANAWSAVQLIRGLVDGTSGSNAAAILGSGAAIYLTNIIVFGLWYWELDRGGPVARAEARRPYPDFMFPQMANPDLAPLNWTARFFDYLWLSYTNATAFSPTDVMPLSRWAKQLMLVQSAVSLSTVALVVARAVNILR